jgi:fructose-specific phosphotransferase system IIC component
MIPFVVVGGIFIALAIGIGGERVPGKGLEVPPNSF